MRQLCWKGERPPDYFKLQRNMGHRHHVWPLPSGEVHFECITDMIFDVSIEVTGSASCGHPLEISNSTPVGLSALKSVE